MVKPEIADIKTNFLPYWVAAIFIGAITYVVFSPSLKCDFTNWDDGAFVYENALIVNTHTQISKIFTSVVVNNDYYPVTTLTLAWNYTLGKLDPQGYHAWNVWLHVLNTLLVFLFVFMLTAQQQVIETGKKMSGYSSLLMASIVALFFGIHPMHVESVAWITERKDVLFLFFFLIGLVAYLKYRTADARYRAVWYVIILLTFILSCLSKGTAVVLPLILILIDYYIDPNLEVKNWLNKIPFFIVAIVFSALTYLLHKHGTLAHVQGLPFFERTIFASYAAIIYAVKLIVPFRLCAFYPYPDMQAIPFYFYLSPFILLGVIAVLYYFFRNNKAVVFSVLFYFISIILMLQFIPTGNANFIMADRYTYLPYIGPLFLIAYIVNISFQNKNAILARLKYVIAGSVIIASLLFSVQTYARTQVWMNSKTLWTDVIDKYPMRHSLAYNNLAAYYENIEGRDDLAFALYNSAISIEPSSWLAYTNRGTIYHHYGNYDSALIDFKHSLDINPDYPETYYHRGLAYEKQQKWALAFADYNTVLQLDTNHAGAYNNRGIYYTRIGNYQLAIADFNKALNADFPFVDAYFNRALLYDVTGKTAEAIDDISKFLQLRSTNRDAYNSRGEFYMKMHKYKQALNDFNTAVEMDPSNNDFLNNRAKAEEALALK